MPPVSKTELSALPLPNRVKLSKPPTRARNPWQAQWQGIQFSVRPTILSEAPLLTSR